MGLCVELENQQSLQKPYIFRLRAHGGMVQGLAQLGLLDFLS